MKKKEKYVGLFLMIAANEHLRRKNGEKSCWKDYGHADISKSKIDPFCCPGKAQINPHFGNHCKEAELRKMPLVQQHSFPTGKPVRYGQVKGFIHIREPIPAFSQQHTEQQGKKSEIQQFQSDLNPSTVSECLQPVHAFALPR